MALGSCYTCIKYLMFAFNFIFWLLGCAILGVGIWLRVDESAVDLLKDSSKMDVFYNMAYVLMVIGFVIMLIGFLGCCGAIRESQCMLSTFFLFLFIIFATLLGFGIWAAIAKESFQEMTNDMLKDGVENYEKDEQKRAFMDQIQEHFACCGATMGTADYIKVGILTSPKSCPDKAIIVSTAPPCSEKLYDWAASKLIVIAGIAIGIAVVMILGMIFSMVLCCAIRDHVA